MRQSSFSGVPYMTILRTYLPKNIVIAACHGIEVLGGLVAYELDKFEKMRREVYICDLAVDAKYRRLHIASAMIEYLRKIASQRVAWVIYVQADYGDEAAIALYENFGIREEVLHFNIASACEGL
jgi:aminoglycoside 3-N-acetyltransferase I